MRRSRMPVRSRIHSSEVSTIRSRSRLVRTRSGTYIPVPAIAAPRRTSGRAAIVRLDLLPDVLVHALLDESRHGPDPALDRLGPAAAVPDETDAVDAEQGCGAVFLPIHLLLEPPHGRAHEQGAHHRERVSLDLLAQLGDEQ